MQKTIGPSSSRLLDSACSAADKVARSHVTMLTVFIEDRSYRNGETIALVCEDQSR